jgi:glycosyltransferase involved in cell wall biosynthesis
MSFISVIICTYNRDKYIYNVLRSVAENTLPNEEYEIVLVNNNCTDNTEARCAQFSRDFPSVNFRYVVEETQGLSYARNRGILESQGEILIYVDDDATVNKDYLQTYAQFFESHLEVDAAGGPIIPVYETAEPRWMSHFTRQLITGKLYLGNQEKKFPKHSYPGGGNAAYRKSVFDKIGNFNVNLGRKGKNLIGAEEKDIFDKMTKQNMQIYYLPTAILYHIISENKLSLDYFNKLTYSIGVSERRRTLSISFGKYAKRLLAESVKWAASLLLWVGFACKWEIQKGNKLIAFRKNVTKGLLNKKI